MRMIIIVSIRLTLSKG